MGFFFIMFIFAEYLNALRKKKCGFWLYWWFELRCLRIVYELWQFYFSRMYFVDLPIPSLLISPSDINFLNAPSIELTLIYGQSSLISCLVNLPSFCEIAFLTSSTTGSFSSTIENLSSNALYAARIIPNIYFTNGNTSSFSSCQFSPAFLKIYLILFTIFIKNISAYIKNMLNYT